MGTADTILVIIAVFIGIGALMALGFYLLYTYAFEVFCSIPVLNWFNTNCELGTDQGGNCTLDSDCKDWAVGGRIACCKGICITKEKPTQTCDAFCTNNPDQCGGQTGGQTTGKPQGSLCTFDSDCQGWSLLGKVACCNNYCITKDKIDQTCGGFCINNPYSSGCSGNGNGVQACTLDSDCPGWTPFGVIACCDNKCITKDYSLQTCVDFCSNHPDQCG